jgi:type II restriction enzyme
MGRLWLKFNRSIPALWREEKVQTLNALQYAKEEALTTLSRERERIMRLSHQEALSELVKRHNLEGRVRAVRAVADNGLMDV